MAKSFKERWPSDVELIVYAEGFEPDEDVTVRRLPGWQGEFKARWQHSRKATGHRPTRYDFRHDAVKFSHKVGALTDAGLSQDDGVLIWLDADTFTHSDVTHDWLAKLFPEPSYVAWLDRDNCYPECGFIMMRCWHRSHQTVMEAYRDIYVSDDVFDLKETHDSFVFQHLIDGFAKSGVIEKPVSLSGDARGWSHPFIAGPLGACLDHAKGDRKKQGRSSVRDLRRPRSEPYWRPRA